MVTVEQGVLVVRLPVEVIAEMAEGEIISDEALGERLPEFGAKLAEGFTGMLSSPRLPRDPKQVRIVRVVLTRSQVIGETTIELAEPIEVFA